MDKDQIKASGRNLYTNSSLSAYRACPRRYYLGYHVGIRKVQTKQSLRMGGAFHLGQEYISTISHDLEGDARQEEINKAVLSAIERYSEPPPGDVTYEEWMIEREIVGRMLHGWAWRWANEPIKTIAGEVLFTQPIANVEKPGHHLFKVVQQEGGPPDRLELLRAGLIDKMCETEDGRRGLLEHKTTGDSIKDDSDYWTRHKMSGQVTYYFKAAQDDPNLPNPDFIFYDVIRKPSIAPRKLTIAEYRDFLGISYRKGKKTIVDPDPKKKHCYYGEVQEVEIVGKIDLGEPENTVIDKVVVDGFEAKMVKSGKNTVIEETPTMYGARLMQDMIDRPNMYFSRKELERLEDDLRELEVDVQQTVEMIMFCERTGQWPKNTDSCLSPWKCEYLPLCKNNVQVTVGGEVPGGYESLDFVHPELADRLKPKASE